MAVKVTSISQLKEVKVNDEIVYHPVVGNQVDFLPDNWDDNFSYNKIVRNNDIEKLEISFKVIELLYLTTLDNELHQTVSYEEMINSGKYWIKEKQDLI